MPSIKKNFIYSSFLTTANIIFPLVVYPYVSRVLGVANLGLCSFINSIIDYFVLFSALGINILGIREIAAASKDQNKLDQTFSSLVVINGIATLVMLFILIGATIFVPRLHQNINLMLIGGFKLLFNFLLIEWFYRGLEEFKYITIRTLIVRLLYVASVFLLVKHENDYPVYFLLTTLMVVINAAINVVHSRKYATLTIKHLNLKFFTRPYIELGVYKVLTSMYTSLNIAYLGFVASDVEIGYYSTAIKLYSIILSLFTAFTGVMMPRMSFLYAEKDMEGFKGYINKSYNFLFSLLIPLIVFSTINAGSIIRIISGQGYEGAVLPMQIIVPIILIVGSEQVLIEQVLMPMKKDKIVTINAFVGATIGILLNLIIVPHLKSVGSAIVIALSELTVFILAVSEVKRFINVSFPLMSCIKQCAYYIPLIIIECFVVIIVNNFILEFFVNGIFLCIYFYVVQKYVLKTLDIIQIAKGILRR